MWLKYVEICTHGRARVDQFSVSNQVLSEQEAPKQPCGDSQHKAANTKPNKQVSYQGGSNKGQLKLQVWNKNMSYHNVYFYIYIYIYLCIYVIYIYQIYIRKKMVMNGVPSTLHRATFC